MRKTVSLMYSGETTVGNKVNIENQIQPMMLTLMTMNREKKILSFYPRLIMTKMKMRQTLEQEMQLNNHLRNRYAMAHLEVKDIQE